MLRSLFSDVKKKAIDGGLWREASFVTAEWDWNDGRQRVAGPVILSYRRSFLRWRRSLLAGSIPWECASLLFWRIAGPRLGVKQFIFEFEGDRAVAAPFLADNRYPRTQQARFKFLGADLNNVFVGCVHRNPPDCKLEPLMGLEPTTYSLQVNCSTNWAKAALPV